MIVLPAAILLLGAVILGTGRRWSPRAVRFIEVGAAVAGLGTSIVVGFADAPGWTLDVGSGLRAGFGEIRFSNAPASWALQAGLLAYLTGAALRREAEPSPQDRTQRAAWLFYAAIVGLAVVGGNLLTVLLLWAALGVAERTLPARFQESGDEAERAPVVSSTDALAAALLIGAGGLGAVTSGQSLGSAVPLVALVGACVVRVVAADRTARRLDSETSAPGPGAEAALLGSLPAFALLSWGVGPGGAEVFPPSLGWVPGAVGMVSAIVLGIGSSPIGRRRAWIVVWIGVGLLVGSGKVIDSAAVFGGAGVVMVLGASLSLDGMPPAVLRLRAVTGALLAGGIPFLAGGVIAGRLPESGPVLIAMAILATALSASRFWRDFASASITPASRSDTVTAGIGLALIVGTSLAVYLRLRGDVVAWLEPSLALVGSVAVAGAFRVVSEARLARLERALRLPDLTDVYRLGQYAGDRSLRVVRGMRDVLEGDASLLWAFVIILVAFLVLRGST